MKKKRISFYPSLALSNIRKNKRLYFPYILTCIGTIAMFYIMCFITFNDGLDEFPGYGSLKSIMYLGTVVVGLFSAIFLFYTNSFLIKRRKNEIGLYSILGMEKRNIALMLFFETLAVMAVSLILGLASGIVFSRLLFMVLCKIVGFTVSLTTAFSLQALTVTLVVFAAVFFLILLFDLGRISLSKPIELLHGGSVGEREPKSKWILTIFGLITTGIGYYIALTVESPIDAVLLFFLAVILVMIGTYSLFTAGSIAILKILRKNKNYYYQTKHFTAVSGMLYRMKQNAVGLANICVLSAGVLILISTTVSMYAGVEDAIEKRYPYDIYFTQHLDKTGDFDRAAQDVEVKKIVGNRGLSIKEFKSYEYLSFATIENDGKFECNDYNYTSTKGVNMFCFFTAEQYNALSGKNLTLNGHETVVYDEGKKLDDSYTVGDLNFTVADRLDEFCFESSFTGILTKIHYVVVADHEILNEIDEFQKEELGMYANSLEYETALDISGSDDEKVDCFRQIQGDIFQPMAKKASVENSYEVYDGACKQENADDFYGTYGGFLFIGVFLGVLFLMITVLIIYYKQISEGYDDKGRFEIMQKVGMSRGEIKKTIRSQILTVFFLPLIGACIHTGVCFRLMTKIMLVFGLTNTGLFAICMAITVAIFALIYLLIYSLTARAYYKIVE